MLYNTDMTSKKIAKTDKEFIELGKKLQDFYETGYINKKQALKFTFLKGMASGLGAFLGGTIVIALLLWVLSFFENIFLLNHVVDIFQNTLKR